MSAVPAGYRSSDLAIGSMMTVQSCTMGPERPIPSVGYGVQKLFSSDIQEVSIHMAHRSMVDPGLPVGDGEVQRIIETSLAAPSGTTGQARLNSQTEVTP
jgi:hypothetical protein